MIFKMPTTRKLVFTNGFYYHVFNRGIDKRPTFTMKRECLRALELINFYRFKDLPLKFSQYNNLPSERQSEVLEQIMLSDKQVDILSYCLMPNHFHFLLKQNTDKGIATFIANFTNSYTRYFNTKHQRVGPLFQGVFKAVFVENDEQMIHLSRYIHLNPVVSSIIGVNDLTDYQWSSYPSYLAYPQGGFTETKQILSAFRSNDDYRNFVLDQVEYAKTLNEIKHITHE